jgi:very-short-patch-repair endonuclease
MLIAMNVVDCLERLGGLATRAALIQATSRAEVDRALAAGDVVVVARGRYALSSVDDAIRHAHRLSGVLSLTNAALHHGWEVKAVPAEPHVTVRRKRRLDKQQSLGVQVHYADLLPEEITDGIATNREVTLAQCLRQLPDDEALAIADSALRHGEPVSTLRRVAQAARGPGAPKVRRIAAQARGEAANPFESGLRSIALSVPGLDVEPQVTIRSPGLRARPDLVDRVLRIALEADSFEWHGDRAALKRDARRYNLLVVDGWIVLRFAWEDVMFDPDYVRSVLCSVVALVAGPAEVCCVHRCAA